jgi:hypothetical protein
MRVRRIAVMMLALSAVALAGCQSGDRTKREPGRLQMERSTTDWGSVHIEIGPRVLCGGTNVVP